MKFRIGFEKEDEKRIHSYWDEIFQNHVWSEGKFVRMFEDKWAEYVGVPYAVAFSSWFGAAMAALEYFEIKGKKVLCPSNTFMATPLSILKAGGKVFFGDCYTDDLCLNPYSSSAHVDAVFLVHIGGHIAFRVEDLVLKCRKEGIPLLEDCAHAHGASWNGKKAGAFGDVGIYSFYGTKTISTGEGGMLVTKNQALAEFAKQYRNYGKSAHLVEGGNYRMNEFVAAIGLVQINRLNEIVMWKNEYAQKYLDPNFPNRVQFPESMISGLYKYIVFNCIDNSTGKVYDQPCHRILKTGEYLSNTDWVAENHWCVPLYYKGDE